MFPSRLTVVPKLPLNEHPAPKESFKQLKTGLSTRRSVLSAFYLPKLLALSSLIFPKCGVVLSPDTSPLKTLIGTRQIVKFNREFHRTIND